MRKIPAAFLLFILACHNPGDGTSSQKPDTAVPAIPPPVPSVLPGPDTSRLAGRWYLQPVLPSDTATGRIPWLDFNLELTRFTGNSGCNSMHGNFYYSKSDSSLSFGDRIVISKRSCPGFNEASFLKSLRNTARYKLRRDTLIFLSDDRSELSRWLRKPASMPKTLKT